MSESRRGAVGSAPQSSKPKKARWLSGLSRLLMGAVGLLIAGVLSGVMLGSIALAVAYPNLPDITGITDYRPKLPMRNASRRLTTGSCECGCS